MSPAAYARLTLILSIIAAALAFAAALIGFLRNDEVQWSLIAAGVFLLAFGFDAKRRLTSRH